MATSDTRSILDYLNHNEPFGLSSRISIRGEACIAIGFDHGNDAAKVTMLDDAGKVVTIRIPTAHQPAKTFQGGQGEVTYQIGDATGFWIGEAAIRNAGRSLRVGSTATRMSDARHASFLAGCLVVSCPPRSSQVGM
jgi:N-acetylglucosamine kinase-like BadF-type ATPase